MSETEVINSENTNEAESFENQKNENNAEINIEAHLEEPTISNESEVNSNENINGVDDSNHNNLETQNENAQNNEEIVQNNEVVIQNNEEVINEPIIKEESPSNENEISIDNDTHATNDSEPNYQPETVANYSNFETAETPLNHDYLDQKETDFSQNNNTQDDTLNENFNPNQESLNQESDNKFLSENINEDVNHFGNENINSDYNTAVQSENFGSDTTFGNESNTFGSSSFGNSNDLVNSVINSNANTTEYQNETFENGSEKIEHPTEFSNQNESSSISDQVERDVPSTQISEQTEELNQNNNEVDQEINLANNVNDLSDSESTASTLSSESSLSLDDSVIPDIEIEKTESPTEEDLTVENLTNENVVNPEASNSTLEKEINSVDIDSQLNNPESNLVEETSPQSNLEFQNFSEEANVQQNSIESTIEESPSQIINSVAASEIPIKISFENTPDFRACKSIIDVLISHNKSWPFNTSVDPIKNPEYFEIIKRPMDFSTIKAKLDNFTFENKEQVSNDIQLIFSNCKLYYSPDSEFSKMCDEVQQLYQKCWPLVELSDEVNDRVSEIQKIGEEFISESIISENKLENESFAAIHSHSDIAIVNGHENSNHDEVNNLAQSSKISIQSSKNSTRKNSVQSSKKSSRKSSTSSINSNFEAQDVSEIKPIQLENGKDFNSDSISEKSEIVVELQQSSPDNEYIDDEEANDDIVQAEAIDLPFLHSKKYQSLSAEDRIVALQKKRTILEKKKNIIISKTQQTLDQLEIVERTIELHENEERERLQKEKQKKASQSFEEGDNIPENSYICLIQYKGVKLKKILTDINSIDDMKREIFEPFKLESNVSIEYFDPEFDEYVLLYTLENIPQKLKIRFKGVKRSSPKKSSTKTSTNLSSSQNLSNTQERSNLYSKQTQEIKKNETDLNDSKKKMKIVGRPASRKVTIQDFENSPYFEISMTQKTKKSKSPSKRRSTSPKKQKSPYKERLISPTKKRPKKTST